jgi:hypothetical protein
MFYGTLVIPRLPQQDYYQGYPVESEDDMIDSDWDVVRTDDTYGLYNLPVERDY